MIGSSLLSDYPFRLTMVIRRVWADMMSISHLSGYLHSGGQNMLSLYFMYGPINPLSSAVTDSVRTSL